MADTEVVQISCWDPKKEAWHDVSYSVVLPIEGPIYSVAACYLVDMWKHLPSYERHLDRRSYRVMMGFGADMELAYLSLDPSPTITPELDPEEAGND